MTPKSRCVAFTYVWQSVNRRVYQQIANKVVEIGGENIKLDAITQRTSAAKSLKRFAIASQQSNIYITLLH